MSVQLVTDGRLVSGGAVLEASDGTVVGVILDTGYSIEIYSDIDTSPSLEDSDTVGTITGGSVIYYVDAVMDGSNNIHILAMADEETTRDVAYAVATYSAGSWTIGTWEQAYNYTEQAPDYPWCKVDLDGNGVPHIHVIDSVKVTGSTKDNCYYANRIGGSWGNIQQIGERVNKNDTYQMPKITLRNSNYVTCYYRGILQAGERTCMRQYTGTWGSETVWSNPSRSWRVLSETDGTLYRFGRSYTDGDIYVNEVDTGYNAIAASNYSGDAMLENDTDYYCVYPDTNYDVHIFGSSEGDIGVVQTGTYYYIIVGWQYNFYNGSGVVHYLFTSATGVGTIWYDVYTISAGETYYQSCAGTLTSSGALKGKAKKALAGLLTSAGDITKKAISFSLAGMFTSAGDVYKEATRYLDGLLTSSGEVTKKPIVSFDGTFTSSGTLVGKTLKALAGLFTSSGDITKKETATSKAGTLTSSGVVTKKTIPTALTGLFTSSGTVVPIKKIIKVLQGVFTSGGDLKMKTSHYLDGLLTSAGNVFKKTKPTTFTGTLTSSGELTAIKKILKSLAGVFTSSGELVKKTKLSFAGTLTSVGDLRKKGFVALSGLFTSSGYLNAVKLANKYYQSVAGTFTSSGALKAKALKKLSGMLTTSGDVYKKAYAVLSGTFTSSGTLVGKAKKFLEGTLTTSGTLVGKAHKYLAGVFTSSGTVRKKTRRLLAGTIAFIGDLIALLGGVRLEANLTVYINYTPDTPVEANFTPEASVEINFTPETEVYVA